MNGKMDSKISTADPYESTEPTVFFTNQHLWRPLRNKKRNAVAKWPRPPEFTNFPVETGAHPLSIRPPAWSLGRPEWAVSDPWPQ